MSTTNVPQIFRAEVTAEGMKFYSSRHAGYYSLSMITREGEIQARWSKIRQEKWSISNVISFVAGFALFFLMSNGVNAKFIVIIYSVMFIIGYLANIILGIIKDRKNGLLKWSAAQNMVINAYHSLERVPTIEEAHTFPCFFDYSHKNFQIRAVLSAILLLISILTIPILLFPTLPILYFVLPLRIFNFIQKLTTREPSDKELQVAIEGVKVWLDNE